MIDWNRYLDLVCEEPEYTEWERVFTPLDVQNRTTGTQFDLMVQAFRKSERPEQEKDFLPGKESEKYDALKGLRKFAGEHVLLRGRPGSGKTTILYKLLLEEAMKARNDSGARIPILVALRRYETSAIDLVGDSLQRHGIQVRSRQIGLLLNQGRLFLLCDGINELPREENRRDLESFRLKYRASTPMVFTTRDLGLGGALGVSKKLEMAPLSPKQIESFVRTYIGDRDPANRMLRALKDRIRELATIPLLLMMLCSVFKAKKRMPDGLGQVFRTFTKTYERVTKGDAPVSAESRRWWPSLLAKLAFRMMEKGQRPTEMALVIPRDEAEKILGEYLKEQGIDKAAQKATQFLDDLINHHLLRKDASSGIEFLHQLVQEYYAAEHLLTCLPRISPAKLKRDYFNYLKWTEPVAMMLELLDKQEQAIECVQLALDVDHMLGAGLAGCLGRKFQEESIKLVAKIPGTSPFKLRLLARTRSSAAVPNAANSVRDKRSDIRRVAAWALGQIGSDQAVQYLIDPLGDKNDKVRSSAAEALGKIGSDKPVDQLITALKDERWLVRTSAANALTEIGSDKTIEHLIRVLEDKSEDVGSSPARRQPKPVGGNRAVADVIRELEDEEPRARCFAARALGRIGGDRAMEHLITALEDKNENVRSTAAGALGHIGGDKVTEHLIKALEDRDESVRSSAISALGDIGGDNVLEYLVKALEVKESWVREIAVDALGSIGSDRAMEHVIKALEDENENVRSSAAWALGEIGSLEAMERLTKASEDKNENVRSSAAWALGEIGGDEAVERLIKALEDKNHEVRASAAGALGEIGSDRATEHLIRSLGDKNHDVRFNAALALGNIGGDKAIDHLVGAIESGVVPSELVSAFLPKSLGSKALPRLTKLAQQKDAVVLDLIAAIQERCRFYNPALLPIDRRFCIVHLSDLHFGALDRAGDLYVGLLLELKKDMDLPGLDALVISGDIVNKCCKDGYNHAKSFLSNVAKTFNLDAGKVVIVPGNHDIDRDVSETSYSVGRRKEVKGPIDEHLHIDKDEYVEVRDEAKYRKRFARFRTLYKKAAVGDYPVEYSKQIICREYPDQKVLIVGLNSSWELDHHYTSRSGLHPDALNQTIEKAAEDGYNDWLKIVVWHHPIKSEDAEETKPNKSWMRDDGFVERLAVAGFSMILTGHGHASGTRKFSFDTDKKKYELHVIGAGTLDADEDELTPGSFWQYNIINVAGTKVSVECRKRENPRGISRPDKTWLKNAPDKSTYDFDLTDESS